MYENFFECTIHLSVKANIKKMADVIEWFRSERPEEKFGFYGEFPQREY